MKFVLKRWKDTSADENSGEKDTYFCFPPHSILFFFFFLLPLLKRRNTQEVKDCVMAMDSHENLFHSHSQTHLLSPVCSRLTAGFSSRYSSCRWRHIPHISLLFLASRVKYISQQEDELSRTFLRCSVWSKNQVRYVFEWGQREIHTLGFFHPVDFKLM